MRGDYLGFGGLLRALHALWGGLDRRTVAGVEHRGGTALTLTPARPVPVQVDGDGFPLRVGNPDSEPAVKFRSYRLVDKFPEFSFEVDGVPVRQRVRRAGAEQLEWAFELGETREPVWVVTGGGVNVASNVGTAEPGRVRLPGGTRKVSVTVGAK